MRIDRQFLRTRLGIALLVLTVGVLLTIGIIALRPFPGRHLVMATGPAGSAYARIGEQYREILAHEGVHVRLVATNGAIDNVRLLVDPHSPVEVGFVQAGTITPEQARHLESLGTLFYEPLWFFCRCDPAAIARKAIQNWRVSIGPEGSASRPLALKLLALNGVDAHQLRLYDYPPAESAQALLAGQLDAMLMIAGWESSTVQRLLKAPEVELIGFPRADAYVALDPTLSKLIVPRGVADLATNQPPQDTPLIASKASLAVRRDIHPALEYLLTQTAIEVHSRPGIFHHAGEFPAAEEIDLPVSEEARHIYRSGPSLLQRTLPFWLADLLTRVLILILPIAGIIYPLWTLLPKLYHWELQRRLNRIYGELRQLEFELRLATPGTRESILKRLDALDQRALDLRLPTTFGAGTYTLKAHIRALRERALAGP